MHVCVYGAEVVNEKNVWFYEEILLLLEDNHSFI